MAAEDAFCVVNYCFQFGVWDVDYLEEFAGVIYNNEKGFVKESEQISTHLNPWPTRNIMLNQTFPHLALSELLARVTVSNHFREFFVHIWPE